MVVEQIKQFNKLYNNTICAKNNKGGVFLTFLWTAIRHGASANDFFRYRFWEKSDFERKNFITYRRSQSIIRKYNHSEKSELLRDKVKFNEFFADNLHRDWLNMDDASLEDFVEFAKKHRHIICKPHTGGQGKGIYIFEYTDDICARKEYESLKGYLVEEIIAQHPAMTQLNPSSVNTVRVVTFNYNGKVSIISAALRTGVKGAVVDNLHSGDSQCWAVDIASGIVFTPSFGYNYESYLFHLGSGYKIIGFQIPNWPSVIETAKLAASRISDIAYIGWDIAVTESDVCLIEGNHDPGHDLMQMIDQKGKYELIRKIVSE